MVVKTLLLSLFWHKNVPPRVSGWHGDLVQIHQAVCEGEAGHVGKGDIVVVAGEVDGQRPAGGTDGDRQQGVADHLPLADNPRGRIGQREGLTGLRHHDVGVEHGVGDSDVGGDAELHRGVGEVDKPAAGVDEGLLDDDGAVAGLDGAGVGDGA